MSILALVLPPPLTIVVVLGAELFGIGLLLFAFGTRIQGRFPRSAAYLAMLRTFAVIGGISMVASGVVGDTTPDTSLQNPMPATVRSVTVGADLFVADCAACHGVDGRGGGPMAATTTIRPADLRSGHLASHTDGDVFYWIGAGLPGGMPAWSGTLSETDRWNLVNYLRSLNGQGPTPAPPATTAAPSPSAAGLLVIPVSLMGGLGWLASGLRRRGTRPRRAGRPRSVPDVPARGGYGEAARLASETMTNPGEASVQ